MSNLYFGGQQIKRPGAYSKVDTLNMIPTILGAFNILCFIGLRGTVAAPSDGAPNPAMDPTKVAYFNQPGDARSAIGDSELMDCLDVAWRHGADLIGVSAVVPTGTAAAWQPSHAYSLNDYVVPTVTNEHMYKVTAAGTCGSSEPTWPTTSGGTVVSSGATFTEVGAPAALVTDANWQTAIDRLETEDVDCLVPVTTAVAIHTKVMTHVGAMSTVNARMERRALYGHATGMSISDIVTLQATYNSERALLVTPGVYVYDSSGNMVLKASHFTASALAGIWASQEPQEPLTYKYIIGFAGLEKRYKSTEITTLLAGHVAPIEYVKNKGYRIVQGLTTSSSPDISQNEWSVSVLKDVMSKNLRSHFEDKFVGKAGVRGIEVTIYNDLITELEGFIKNGWISEYMKDSVRVVKDATSFYLDYEAKPTLPINNILITSHFTL